MRVATALMCFVALTAASAPKYKGHWTVDSNAGSRQSLIFEKNKYQKIGKVVPARLFELSGDSIGSKGQIGYLGRGTLMVPVDESLRKFCRFERHLGSAFGCLSDSDADGRLDTYFGTQVFKEFFTGSVGDDGGHETLKAPVSINEVDPHSRSPQIDLEFLYLGKSGDKISYQFCLSKQITDGIKFYQSPKRKGYSVVCSARFKVSLKEATRNSAGFGFELKFNRADAKTLDAELQLIPNSIFETTSGFS